MPVGLRDIILRLPGFLIAISFHEYAHARMALALGDDTAELSGRLTLEPWAHIDPVGAIMLLIFGFGWARPVPVNPYRLRDPKKDMAKIAVAGPLMNFVLAMILEVVAILAYLFVPPVRGAWSYLPGFLESAAWINAGLGVFNLIPLPPLDGSRIVELFLPSSAYDFWETVQRYSFIILVALLSTGILSNVMSVPLRWVMGFAQRIGFSLLNLLAR